MGEGLRNLPWLSSGCLAINIIIVNMYEKTNIKIPTLFSK